MTYQVSVQRLDISALFDLKGSAEALRAWAGDTLPPFPGKPCTRTQVGARTLIWAGPEHWILRAPIEEEDSLLRALKPEDALGAVSIVLISDTLVFFRITGPDAADVMNIASPLDIHPRAFPENGAAFTQAFGQRALVLRCEGGFELAPTRSYGPMTEDYLNRVTG